MQNCTAQPSERPKNRAAACRRGRAVDLCVDLDRNALAKLLERLPWFHDLTADIRLQAPVFVAVGLLLYTLAVAMNYLLIAFEASNQAESRNLELAYQAREAEREAARERNQAEKERELARALQQRLLPPAQVDGRGYRLGAHHQPAQFVGATSTISSASTTADWPWPWPTSLARAWPPA